MRFKKGLMAFALACTVVAGAVGGSGALAPVQAEENSAPHAMVNPVAWYEFKDSSNFGKDTMGNYDMEYRNAWVSGGTGALLNKGTLIEGGGVAFDEEFCVAQDKDHNLFANVNAFTLAFEIKTAVQSEEWDHYLGIGNASKYLAFVGRSPADCANNCIFNATDVAGEYWGGAWFSDAAVWQNADTTFQKVVVSVQPGGQMNIWLNGTLFTKANTLPKDLSADWNLNTTSYFSIGARFNGAADRMSTGAVRNVAIYDFAMDENEAKSWTDNGILTVDNLTTTIDSASLAVGQNIAIRYDVATYTKGMTMDFVMNGETVTAQAKGALGNEYFEFEVAPQCIGDTITANLKYAGETLATKNYSVKEYCAAQIASDTASAELKTLCSDILVYGAAAQEYRNHNVEALATAGVEGLTCTTFAAPVASTRKVEGTVEGAAFTAGNVWFDSINKACFVFTADTLEGLTVKVDDVVVAAEDVIDLGNGKYMVQTDALYAVELDEAHTATLTVGDASTTMTYSVADYVLAKHEDATIGNLVKALYNYGVSAKAYAASLNA